MTAVGDISAYIDSHATTESDQKSWSDGGANKVLLHGLVGAAVASLGGNNALQGGLGAAASETASGAMEQYLVEHDISPYSPEGKSLLGLASAAIGEVAGGGTGATTALQGEQFNQQLHPEVLNELLGKVDAFAKEYGLSESDARNRLLLEAMRLQDNGTNTGLSTTQLPNSDGTGGSPGLADDAQARAFLAANDNFSVNGQAVDIFKPAAPDDSAANAYALYTYLYQNPTAAQAFYGAQEYGQAERGFTTNEAQQNQLLAQWANQDVIANYLPADQAKQVDAQVNQTELDFLKFEGTLALAGATAGAGSTGIFATAEGAGKTGTLIDYLLNTRAGVAATAATINVGAQTTKQLVEDGGDLSKVQINWVEAAGAAAGGYLGAGNNLAYNILAGSASGMAQTETSNLLDGENNSLVVGGVYGAATSGAGYTLGKVAKWSYPWIFGANQGFGPDYSETLVGAVTSEYVNYKIEQAEQAEKTNSNAHKESDGK